jgi:hypothetical protein
MTNVLYRQAKLTFPTVEADPSSIVAEARLAQNALETNALEYPTAPE